ncbi:MAG: hypothetical protein HY366_02785 [Candidatus Aenigmarchaeota archaeon]|nr:hypothetical protein [Candidatus Aenigmarchaeota archaeon]
MNTRKGQAAIEYLTNYTWAIAVIIIVGIAIFGLNIGGVRNSLTSQSSTVIQGGEQLSVVGYTCSAGLVATVSVQNNGATLLKNIFVNITPNNSASGVEAAKANYTYTTCNGASATNLFPGQSVACTSASGNSTLCATKAGQSYTIMVSIAYTDDNTGVVYKPVRNFTGTLQAA